MPKKKKKEGGKPPSWLTTFGDMNNLLLTFFVLMFTTAEIDGEKLRLILSPFNGSMGPLTGGMTLEPGKLSEMGHSIESLPSTTKGSKLAMAYEKAISYLRPEVIAQRINITIEERGIIITLGSDFYFKPGSSELNNEAKQLLQRIYNVFSSIPNLIQIEGHTDNTTIAPGSRMYDIEKIQNNWDLGYERASNVLVFLEDLGIGKRRLSAVSFGDTRPLESNDSPKGRAYNRRVEIIVKRDSN